MSQSLGFLEVLGVFSGAAVLISMVYYGCLCWGLRQDRLRRQEENAQPLITPSTASSMVAVEF